MDEAPMADSNPRYPVRVLLVDDQRMVGEAVRRMLLDEPSWVYQYCQHPEEAIATAEAFQPTVILQDLVMPGIDGLSLVDSYSTNPLLKDVPTIVLSSQEEPLVKADAFARGAHDYLVKLPDRIELLARIRHHSKGYIHLIERNEAFRALDESQKVLAAELSEAADYVRSLLPEPVAGPISVRWDFESCSSVGGDSFGYFWIDDDHFAIYLLDVCGHGVGAALLSVSVINTIKGQTLRDVDFREPDRVLARLNDVFDMERHNDMYFTIWYGVYNRHSANLRYATGGHPPALLYAAGNPEPQQLVTPSMPIGTMPDMPYKVKDVQVEDGSRLYVFSDGVYEVQINDEEMTLDEFIPLLSSPIDDPKGLLSIRDEVAKLQGSDQFEDDFSLVEIQFNISG